jgi:hypothetical protein
MTYQDYLGKIYYDPQHPGSLGGVDKLYKAIRQEGKYVLGKAKIRGGKQFGFVTKVFWQSSRVDSVGQLVSSGSRDNSDVGESYGIIHLL